MVLLKLKENQEYYFEKNFIIKICEIIFFGKLHINASQVERLSEDKIYDYSEASKDFLFNPKGFEEGIEIQINNYKHTKKNIN